MHCSMPSSCLAWAIHGAVSKASSFRSIAHPTAPPPHGRRAGQRCGFTSGWRMSTISKPISSAALRPSTPRSPCPHARRSAMSSTYNARSATAYEHFMGRWSRQLSPRFVEFAGISDGERILDVGCGTGSLTRVLLESADVKTIVGMDLADVYLESARQTIRDPRVDFKTGDATSLPFADKSFDRAFAMLVLHFVPDAKKAVGEMRRVVRSGGVVAATVWDGLGGMPALRLFWDAAATLGIADGKVLRDFYFRPMTRPNEMRAAWSEAGLR